MLPNAKPVPSLLLSCGAIAALFVLTGVGFWNNILAFPKLAVFFGIDEHHARFIQALYSVGYTLFAVPAALFHRQYGYRIGMIFALGLVSVGPFLIYPAITQHGVAFFLIAVVVMGAGWSMLETSLNPLAIEIGRPETAVRRLNFVQAFFPVGLVAGYLIAKWFYPSDLHLSFNVLAEKAARPYVVVGLAVLFVAFLVERVEFPARCGIRSGGLSGIGRELSGLLSNRSIRFGAAAIFCCIALQSTLQGATYVYVQQQYPGSDYLLCDAMVLNGLLVFGIGRFAGTALMGWIDANRLLLWAVSACVALAAGAVAIGGKVGFVCLISTNLCLGIGYPTIIGTVVRELRSASNLATGLLVTASGLAGLATPLAMNYLVEASDARIALLLAMPCFPVLFAYLRHIRAATAPLPQPAQAV